MLLALLGQDDWLIVGGIALAAASVVVALAHHRKETPTGEADPGDGG
ncbi:hypothetical protein [Actinocatenispora rupis]|uniref:Uncharacterized protein n=1 Tax=Actinocatenispora rupis TaxID=519421 RepID=A0A8J3NEM9_9ACTN|nr:hypothetical protein [Actinocatenispora rupis]GID14242.1 hypothetical protein Aru02nite_51310 [Actinocatenispora rupis]